MFLLIIPFLLISIIPIQAQQEESNLIPIWVKGILFDLWADGSISDESFIQVLEVLIDSNIIQIDTTVVVSQEESEWEEKYTKLEAKHDKLKDNAEEGMLEWRIEVRDNVAKREAKTIAALESKYQAKYDTLQAKYDTLQVEYDTIQAKFDE